MDNRIPPILKKYIASSKVKEKDALSFLSFDNWLRTSEHTATDWILVARSEEIGNESYFTMSCLVKGSENSLKGFVSACTFDVETTFGVPSIEETEKITRIKGMKLMPFVFRRHFKGHCPDAFEFIQDFLLLYNSFWVEKTREWRNIDDNGLVHTLAKHSFHAGSGDDRYEQLLVDAHVLKRYLTFRDVYLVRYHDHRRRSETEISEVIGEFKNVRLKNEQSGYSLDLRTDIQYNKIKSSSRLLGKDIIKGYQEKGKEVQLAEQFMSFIIGRDGEGKLIELSCDPSPLSSYFTDKGTPHFLTSVFFKPEVLQKYYSQPGLYTVDDYQVMYLHQWSIDYDMTSERLVHVYLGDLGQSLSYEEQLHWRQFNVAPKGEMSDYRFKADFLAEWALSTPEQTPVGHFKEALENLQERVISEYNQPFFLPLLDDDKHAYKTVRVPLTDEGKEHDEQILSLTKILNDSLNVPLLSALTGKSIGDIDIKGSKIHGSLALLLDWLRHHFTEEESASLIEPFTILQALRSSGSAHRKGANYQKTLTRYQLEGLSNSGRIRELLLRIMKALKTISGVFREIEKE